MITDWTAIRVCPVPCWGSHGHIAELARPTVQSPCSQSWAPLLGLLIYFSLTRFPIKRTILENIFQREINQNAKSSCKESTGYGGRSRNIWALHQAGWEFWKSSPGCCAHEMWLCFSWLVLFVLSPIMCFESLDERPSRRQIVINQPRAIKCGFITQHDVFQVLD